jgi:hypothetical protein
MWCCFGGRGRGDVSQRFEGLLGFIPQKSSVISHKTRTLGYITADTFNLLYLLFFLFEIFMKILLKLEDIFSVQHVLCLPFALCILYAHFHASFGTLLIGLHWIPALTVPMHLGLRDGPFVPHNLISAQESTVPLPTFQMAPRLKILMSSGSKKGTQIYYPFLAKSPGKRIPSRFPQRGPYWEREREGEREIPAYRVFLHISWYISISKVLRKEGPSKRAASLWWQTPIP